MLPSPRTGKKGIEMNRLSQDTLSSLPSHIGRPEYDRGEISPGIVHFGVGGFHRAHQALVVDRLMADGEGQDWGIVGVGLLPGDAAMRDALSAQDYLYTLMEYSPSGERSVQVVGSMVGYLFAPDDPEAVLELMASPAVRIVSLTVTEGGYNYDQVSGEFLWSNPDAVADADSANQPVTVFGYLARALARRRERGVEPFTVMSCDNIQGNGELTRKMLVAFAERFDPDLANWIEATVAFPNSMVDRITPVTTDDHRAMAQDETGLVDRWPVGAESFFQWVLEDRFPAGRPRVENAGVQIVDDVVPYELMKLRLLNASHQALAYFGALSGYHYVHEAIGDALIEKLVRRYMTEEAEPTLAPVEGIDLADYQNTLIRRFGNANVKDTVARLCADASNRIPKWLVPVIIDRLDQGGEVTLSAAVVASWSRYSEGTTESGELFSIDDAAREERQAAAQAEHSTPLSFVTNQAFFGDLADRPGFTVPYRAALEMLWTEGAQATLAHLVSETR